MARRQFFRFLPHGIHRNFEVFETASPGFHRVCGHPRVPVQLVDREVSVFDRRQDSRQLYILHMRVGPEFQAVESQRHAPSYAPAKRARIKIRHLQAAIVDSIAALAGETAGMKDFIRQRDILPGVAPTALVLAAGKLAFSAYIDPPCRHHGIAQSFPEIQQIDPAAVPETPLRIREIIHFRLGIEMRVPGAEYSLLKGESFAPYRKLCREPHRQRYEVLRCELHGLPIKIAEIQGILQRAPGLQPEPQVSPMHGNRCFEVVVEQPPVSEQHAPDMPLEERVAQRLVDGNRPRRRRHIGRTVLFHADVHVWFLHHKFIKRNPVPPEGNDAQSGLHFFSCE